ncbi:hypothetical protein KEM60_01339 [Austwickia sp. TVS 96-490-7B]|uniref:GNAT family N-acetyltransferase n=1 Tax=Austwickia sp. TVS 96-490-7B TaxID=2830843 RepID=UPI001DDEA2F2|nr:GNAT family N-acetyltransferase [Austwickia sp. TVS 96-490-7B]MBW3085142.1 hypothetical protein [Austwickia sp. TVS 96-490-7B]
MHPVERLHSVIWRAWPGLFQERLGDWVIRIGQGFTQRANSALPIGDPGLPLDQAVARVEEIYHHQGLTPSFQIPFNITMSQSADSMTSEGTKILGLWEKFSPPASQKPLDLVLTERHYEKSTPVIIQTLKPEIDIDPPAWPSGFTAEWTRTPTAGWISRSKPQFHTHPYALAVTTAHPAIYLTLWRGHHAVGHGRISIIDDWYNISDLEVAPHLRGRGLGQSMLRFLAHLGGHNGTNFGILQVEASNVRAARLYRSLGWQDQGGYYFRSLDA